MKVLLTGAFGNVGRSALEELLRQGHQVRCFDLKTRRNRRLARRFGDRIEVVWGDLRRPEDVARAVEGQEVVLHLAFIIPKLSATGVESESRPDWAYEINVGGTRNLLEAMQAQPNPPRLIFSSSVHVYGRCQDRPPPRTAEDPVRPAEHYSRHKVLCETMIKASGLEWTILRFGAVLPLDLRIDLGMFDVPLGNRIEFVHTRDVGLALANAVSSDEVWGKTLLIAGGPGCRFHFGEMAGQLLEAMGVGMLPEEAFSRLPFCTDWMDTTESQRILQYRRHTFQDYVQEMAGRLGLRRHLVRLFRPLVRAWLLRRSPYYRDGLDRKRWAGRVALVTGASDGIGAATARLLAAKGFRLALVARREERLESLAAEIRLAGGEALPLAADLCDEGACRQVVRRVRETYGPVDLLVNNAGLGWYGYCCEMPWEIAQQMIQVNIVAATRMTMLLLPEMRRRNQGQIINIGSVSGSLPSPGAALYSATKSFLDTFSTALYRELRGTKVRVSVLRPGAVLTDFFHKASAMPAAMPMPAERFGVAIEAVSRAVWALVERPRRVAYVPRILGVIPWVELYLGWFFDRVGHTLLQRQRRSAESRAR